MAAGFLVYDLVFIPPYSTLSVGARENWTALVGYAVVMVLVARVVSSLDEARSAARRREVNASHLVEMSELLLGDKPLEELGPVIVHKVHEIFALAAVTLLVAVENRLDVVASSGEPISKQELARLQPDSKMPVALSTATSSAELQTVALAAAGRPVGLLVLRGLPADPLVRELLPILANHLALALEQSQLRERLQQAELFEEIDRLRRALVGAVSHDLRTPLATIKVASSTLVDPRRSLSSTDIDEMHCLIDQQTDRLTRLVNNLLDMTRIQAGVLEVRPKAESVLDMAIDTLVTLRPSLGEREVLVQIPDWLPAVDADRVLIGQVLSNVLDNADRHGPPGTPIILAAELRGDDRVALSVSDCGPGVPLDQRGAVFETFVQFDTGGRSGLGLAIAKAFVEAHGDHIWIEDAPGGGARFVFTLPRATRAEVGG